VLADQTRLQRLHAQLQQDYDRLRQEREDLKTSERGLRLEIAKLRYQSLPRLIIRELAKLKYQRDYQG
jgi:cell division protein FtsB